MRRMCENGVDPALSFLPLQDRNRDDGVAGRVYIKRVIDACTWVVEILVQLALLVRQRWGLLV
jgi:hypothetical protein